jgi:hypothetical protein
MLWRAAQARAWQGFGPAEKDLFIVLPNRE